jgi:hypothetical protein
MGLLDEAIRDHLELKRRSGADPSVVAREEHDALAPVFPDEHAEPDSDHADRPQPAAAESARGLMPGDGDPGPHKGLADLSTVGQDTAELDMQAVMEADLEAGDPASAIGASGDGAADSAYEPPMPKEAPLDWEVPSAGGHESTSGDAAGQERLSLDES